MKKLMRGLAPAFLAACFLGLAGCGADNESEADRLQRGNGAPPTTTVKGGEAPTQAKTYDEYAKRRQEELSKDPRKDSEYAKAVGGAKR